jgi:hypothetical protein
MPLRCKGKLMSELRRGRISLSLLSAVIVMTALASGGAFATDLIILREVPPHNAIEKSPLGPAVTVQVEQGELIQSLLNGPKLDDDDFGAVLASPPGGSLRGGVPLAGDTVNALDGSRGDALSNVPNSGMGSFSSLNGLGGEISGQVNNAVQSGLDGLSSALGAATGGQ